MKPYRRLSFLLFSIVMALSLGCSEEGSTGAAGPEYTFQGDQGGPGGTPGLPGDPQDGTKPEGGTEGGGSETEGEPHRRNPPAFYSFSRTSVTTGNRAQERPPVPWRSPS